MRHLSGPMPALLTRMWSGPARSSRAISRAPPAVDLSVASGKCPALLDSHTSARSIQLQQQRSQTDALGGTPAQVFCSSCHHVRNDNLELLAGTVQNPATVLSRAMVHTLDTQVAAGVRGGHHVALLLRGRELLPVVVVLVSQQPPPQAASVLFVCRKWPAQRVRRLLAERPHSQQADAKVTAARHVHVCRQHAEILPSPMHSGQVPHDDGLVWGGVALRVSILQTVADHYCTVSASESWCLYTQRMTAGHLAATGCTGGPRCGLW